MSDNLSTDSIRKDFGVNTAKPARAGARLLLLLLVVATVALGYFSWQQQQTVAGMQSGYQTLSVAASTISSLQQAQGRQDKNQQELDQRLKLIEQELQQLQSVQQQLGSSQQQAQLAVQQQMQMTLNSVNEQSGQLNNMAQEIRALRGKVADSGAGALRSQILAEALGMLRLADLRLQVAQDFDSAIALVRNSDGMLAKLSDAPVAALRTQLAEDLNALQAAQQGDAHKVYQQLSEAITQLGSLTAVSKTASNDTAMKAAADTKPAEPGWLNSTLGFLGQYFVITQRDAAITPLLTPEQSWYIRKSIELQLQQARMAALNSDAALYKSSLTEAQVAISETLQGEGKDALMKKLSSLQAVTLRSGIHSLAGTIQSLQQLQVQAPGKAGTAP